MNIRVRAAISRLIFNITIRSDCIKCSQDSLAIISMELMKWNVIFHVDFFSFYDYVWSFVCIYTHSVLLHNCHQHRHVCHCHFFIFYCIIVREWHLRMIYVIVKWKKKEFCIASKKVVSFFFCKQLLNNDLKSLYCHFIHWLWQTLNFK